jgi:hypothetical protein
MWLVLSLKTEATLSVLGKTKKVPISDMAEGCVGCLLAFDTKEQAAECAGEGGSIVEIGFK